MFQNIKWDKKTVTPEVPGTFEVRGTLSLLLRKRKQHSVLPLRSGRFLLCGNGQALDTHPVAVPEDRKCHSDRREESGTAPIARVRKTLCRARTDFSLRFEMTGKKENKD